MKLLSKQDVDLAKARERKMEIDEGKKLAERVDILRNLLPAEMAKLEQFRDKTMTLVKAEIAEIIAQKESLNRQVHDAEQRKIEALKPLTRQHEELDARIIEVEKVVDSCSILAASIAEDRQELDARTTQMQANIFDIERRDIESIRINEEAQKTKKDAIAKLREAAFVRDTAKKEHEQSTDDLKRREALVAVREREASLKDESFARRERALSLKERAIIDKEQELARELRRIIQN